MQDDDSQHVIGSKVGTAKPRLVVVTTFDPMSVESAWTHFTSRLMFSLCELNSGAYMHWMFA